MLVDEHTLLLFLRLSPSCLPYVPFWLHCYRLRAFSVTHQPLNRRPIVGRGCWAVQTLFVAAVGAARDAQRRDAQRFCGLQAPLQGGHHPRAHFPGRAHPVSQEVAFAGKEERRESAAEGCKAGNVSLTSR